MYVITAALEIGKVYVHAYNINSRFSMNKSTGKSRE